MAIKESKEEVSQERLKGEDDKDEDENTYNSFTNFCLCSRFLAYIAIK